MVTDGNALVEYHWLGFVQVMRNCNWLTNEPDASFHLRQVLYLIQDGFTFKRPSGFDTVIGFTEKKGYEEMTLLLNKIDQVA